MVDISIQRGQTDVPLAGTTATLGASVSSLSNAFILPSNNRFMSAGPPSDTGDQGPNDMGLGMFLSDVDEVTFVRLAGSINANTRAAWEVWEYTGAASGDDEFIVRDRLVITLNGVASNTASVTTGDRNRCIPFITGIVCDQTAGNMQFGAVNVWMPDDSTVEAYREGITGTVTVYVTLVEFTGSNWILGYGYESGQSGDSGSTTIYNNFDASGTTTDVGDWANALIWIQASSGDGAVADLWPRGVPGADTETVDWEFHADHSATHQIEVRVLGHPDMVVTRIQDTGATVGANNVSVAAAGLSDLSLSSVIVAGTSSGTGDTYGQGWENARLTSTTNVELYRHRAWGTTATELQIVNFASATVQAALSSTSTIVAAASSTRSTAGALSSTSTATVAATHVSQAVATLSSTSAIEATVRINSVAELSSSSTLEATASSTRTTVGASSSSSTMAATVSASRSTAGALSSTSMLTSAASRLATTVGALSSTSTATAVGARLATTAAVLASTSTLAVIVTAPGQALAALSSASTISAVASRRATTAGALSSTSTMTAVASSPGQAAAALSSTSTLAVAASRIATAAAALSSTSLLEVTATGIEPGAAVAALSSTSTLTAVASQTRNTVAALSSTSTMTVELGVPTLFLLSFTFDVAPTLVLRNDKVAL